MRKLAFSCAVAIVTVFLVGAAPAAEPLVAITDCPQARAPYSIDTLLIDLLLDPRASSAIEEVFPQLDSHFSARPPTLAATMTPRILTEYVPLPAEKMQALDKTLAAIPITEDAAIARCARYDHIPPTLPAPKKRPSILVFEKITGFRDEPSVNAARKALNAMALRRGWSIAFTDNGAVFDASQLRNFDTVVWNNVSGDVLTVGQREAFKTYVENGGGFAGIHGSGGDHIYLWDWYADTLIGARFIGHPMNPQFQAGVVRVKASASGITANLPEQWTMTEEWYSFAANPKIKGARILLTLDESSYKPEAKYLMRGEHPLAWTQCIKNGRSFYTAIGHRPESYTEPNSAELLEQGVAWSAGGGATLCKNGEEVELEKSPRMP